MINWPARLFQRRGARAPTADYQPSPYRRSGDKDMLDAADRALRTVIDPELGINIVDLGLVYQLRAHEGRVEAEIGLTSPSCPLADYIAGQACDAIWEEVEDAIAVKVTLDRERRWSSHMVTPAGRRQLRSH